jgi:pseudouridylate synthase I
MRKKITFAYDGTMFNGYQKQPNLRTVEEELEKALFNINNHQCTDVVASGRTDRGVHALAQCAHFDIDIDITLYKLKCALNSLLPKDISVISTEDVDNNFHARYMVNKKIYRYILNMGEYDPIKRNYEFQYNRRLDVEKIKEAIKVFKGKHDFKSFVSEEAKKESYVRNIFKAIVKEHDNKLIFEFTGSGFGKYQIRSMVGTLVRIGEGKLDIEYIKNLLNQSVSKNKVYTIGAEGLYLVKVIY